MEEITDIGIIPLTFDGIRNIYLSTCFNLDTEFDQDFYHQWTVVVNIEFMTGDISEDLPFEIEDVHFTYVLESVFSFLKDNGYSINVQELLGNLELYNKNILPHLLNPGNHLENGDDGFYNQDQRDYLRRCCEVRSQNHLIHILENEGQVWEDAVQEYYKNYK